MNFSQHWRTEGIVEVSYEVHLPMKFVEERFEQWLPQIVEDARHCPEDDRPFEAALRAQGWPTAQQAMANPQVAQPLAEDLAHDLLLEWLGDGEPESLPGAVANTIERLEWRVDTIVVSGTARRAGVPVRYQDV